MGGFEKSVRINFTLGASLLDVLPVFWIEAASLAQHLSLSVQVTLFFFLTFSPDSQTLTRCREFADDSSIKPTL